MLPRLTQSPGMVKYSTPPIMRILRRGRLLRWSHLLDTARDSVLYTGSDQRMDSLRQLNRNFATRNKPYKKVNCERDMTLAVRFVVHVSCEETLMRKKGKETCQHCIVIPATKNVQLTAAPRKIDWTLLRAKTNNNSTGTRTEDIFDLKEKEVIPMASPIKLVHHLSPSQQHPQGFCEYWLGGCWCSELAWIPITWVQCNGPFETTDYLRFINGCHDCELTKHDVIISIRKVTVSCLNKGTNCINARTTKLLLWWFHFLLFIAMDPILDCYFLQYLLILFIQVET